MQVFVSGGTKYQNFEAEEAALWAADQLMQWRLHKNIFVEIEVVENLFIDENAIGFTAIEGETIRPREFKIVLDSKLSNRDFIRTVMHEMVHVRQWAKGELKERVRPLAATYWMNEDHTNTKYEDQPWEIEAYCLQDILAKTYIQQIKTEK